MGTWHCETYHTENTITVKHGGVSIMLLWELAGTGKLVSIDNKIIWAKHRAFQEENLGLMTGQMFTSQQDNNPKHTTKTILDWFKAKNLNVLEWPSHTMTSFCLRISDKTYTDGLHPVWQSLSNFAKKNGWKYQDPDMQHW